MAVEDRFGGVQSKRLRHAFATQEIEANPMTPAEIALFRKMEIKGWNPARQRKFLIGRLMREQRQVTSRQLDRTR
ncbi:hypothetical protein [Parasulfitobacter algicola]|uniref:Uncharacterized protein n=1 Tax=Parasulfitobacter algicola TaxID=2614809 RepID=A0ABX2J117_9RHOB|nr:hypothetical protein [Sulfitobacter algicola]NSX56874.1 hypothetical protein [Sulfitobacter algicola]